MQIGRWGFVISALALTTWVPAATALTADAIVRDYIAARGGYERLKAVETMTTTERVPLEGGEVVIKRFYKRPHLYRLDQHMPGGDVVVRVVNNELAWVKMGSGRVVQRPDFAAKHQREGEGDFDGVLVDYEKKGHAVEYAGDETIDGTTVHRLEVQLASGAHETFFIDAATHLVKRHIRTTQMPSGEETVTETFADYRDVQGIQIPYSITVEQGGGTFHLTRTEVALNTPVDDALFEMPAEEVPFRTFEELSTFLQKQTKANRFSGVVMVLDGWSPVFQHAYGYADKRTKRKNNAETKFNLGSITKVFTSVAVLQLAQSGKLRLDDPLSRFLPDFPRDVADKVTIRHLLQHKSGWGAYWDSDEFVKNKHKLRKIADYLAFLKDLPLDFEPGTKHQYSNTGYEVLGGVIEAASGKDYYEYVRENIYDPAGMASSGSYPTDEAVDNLAIGYTNFDQWEHPRPVGRDFSHVNTDIKPIRGTAAGGSYSTAGDLARFVKALADGKLLDRRYTTMFMNGFKDVDVVPDKPTGQIGVAGGGPGVNAGLEWDFTGGRVVIVLSNYDPPTAEDLTVRIMDMVQQ
jgi:D-alanyl-D-alanine carboxypeptidase